jgi:hypothetical protein
MDVPPMVLMLIDFNLLLVRARFAPSEHPTDTLTLHECAQAGVAELADALDLGSSGATRGGSNPLARILSAQGPDR